MCITMSSDTMADPVTSFSFTVGFHTSQGRLLGMHLNEDKCLGDIYVSQVSPDISTLIGQWNAENPSDRICPGDQVVTINHKKGWACHRHQKTLSRDFIELTFMRNCQHPTSHRAHFVFKKRTSKDVVKKNELKQKAGAFRRLHGSVAVAHQQMQRDKRLWEDANSGM